MPYPSNNGTVTYEISLLFAIRSGRGLIGLCAKMAMILDRPLWII
jgi:hypothetical protein